MIRALARAAALVVALAFTSAPAFAANQLPVITGPGGPASADPAALVNPNGGTPCVVGPTCRLPVDSGPDMLEVIGSGSALNAVLIDQDVTGYGSVAFQVTNGGSGNSLLYRVSNDRVNWAAQVCTAANNPGTSIPASSNSVATGQMYQCDLKAKYFQVSINFYNSGTVTTLAEFRRNALGPVGTSAKMTPGTSGGLSMARIRGAASGVVKSSGGQVYGYDLLNTQASARYLQFYNKTSAGVPGTDTPVRTVPLAANGAKLYSTDVGLAFATGMSWAITTDEAGATAASAGDVIGTVDYF